jgi:hypothetical protein
MSAILPQFLTVLPENLSFNKERSFISCLKDEKHEMNAATTGFVAEIFLSSSGSTLKTSDRNCGIRDKLIDK